MAPSLAAAPASNPSDKGAMMTSNFIGTKPLLPRKVLVIDQQAVFRLGLALFLTEANGWSGVGATENAAEGIGLARHFSPDLILLGLSHVKNMETLESLRAIQPQAVILAFSSRVHESDIRSLLGAGADECLSRDITVPALQSKLCALHRDKRLVSGMASHQHPGGDDDAGASIIKSFLTKQEGRILERLAAGKCNKLIGRELGIAEATVKVHLKKVYKKLNCHSRTQAANYFLNRQQALDAGRGTLL
jgi:two-component system nitrate/nitrite response regulator NarL